MLEKINRRAPSRTERSHEEILKECGLTTLETRRLNGYERVDSNIFFSKLYNILLITWSVVAQW